MHKISRLPGLRLGGAYNATTHAIAGFRGKVPGKGTGKGRDRERGRVMEGGEENKGWKGGEGREGRLAPWVQGETPPFNSSKQTKFFLRFGTTHYVR